VIVERPVLAAFTEKLVAAAKAWKVGPGLSPGVQMGPAVNADELEGNFAAIRKAQADGAELVWGGARLTEGDLAHGLFMQPTVLGGVTPTMEIAQEEVFGPVVGIIAVDSFDEAIQVANGVKYGLSASLVTRDFKKAMVYAERIECGVVKVNQISTGLALQAPFGGVKNSSTDSFREQGTAALDFYSRTKTIYLDYSA
jgi:aldehyde dehydrogenase (NAD+)